MSSNNGTVWGWGVNDANYPVAVRPDPSIRGKSDTCLYYARWNTMIGRVRSGKKPTYIGCSINDHFRHFMEYREWCISNGLSYSNRKYVEIDKDILIPGNREYSKEGCSLVTGELNRILHTCDSKRGDYLLGVKLDSRSSEKKYIVTVSKKSKTQYVGVYRKEEDAHKSWQIAKAEHIDSVLAEYQTQSELLGIVYREDVVASMYKRSSTLRDYAESGKITENFI